MQSFGQRLRAEREKKGLSIPELARMTRIRSEYFEAIENDRTGDFPGTFFYRSFLRQYVSLLGLPESIIEHEIQRSMDDERALVAERIAQTVDNKPDVPPLPTGRSDLKAETQRWLLRVASLVAVLAVCSGIYFAWMRWGQRILQEERSSSSAALRQAKPVAQPPPSASATPPGVPEPVPSTAEPPPSGTPAQTSPGTPAQAAPTEVKPANPESAPTAEAPAPNAGATLAQALPENDLVVQASELCWVDGWRDGKHFYSAMLRPGATAGFGTSGALRLRFGNAGAVTLRLKGETLPSIGPRGQVRVVDFKDGEYRPAAPAEQVPAKQ